MQNSPDSPDSSPESISPTAGPSSGYSSLSASSYLTATYSSKAKPVCTWEDGVQRALTVPLTTSDVRESLKKCPYKRTPRKLYSLGPGNDVIAEVAPAVLSQWIKNAQKHAARSPFRKDISDDKGNLLVYLKCALLRDDKIRSPKYMLYDYEDAQDEKEESESNSTLVSSKDDRQESEASTGRRKPQEKGTTVMMYRKGRLTDVKLVISSLLKKTCKPRRKFKLPAFRVDLLKDSSAEEARLMLRMFRHWVGKNCRDRAFVDRGDENISSWWRFFMSINFYKYTNPNRQPLTMMLSILQDIEHDSFLFASDEE